MHNSIAIIDLGGQYARLIQRRLRDLGVHSLVYSPPVSPLALDRAGFSGIILSGGPQSVYAPGAPTVDKGILSLATPILGICYGHQLLGHFFGARVEPVAGEYGAATLRVLEPEEALFNSTPERQTVWMSHHDSLTWLPPSLTPIAETAPGRIAAFRNWDQTKYGVQFHPEVDHTEWGNHILGNFAFGICKIAVEEDSTVEEVLDETLEEIREAVQDRSVFFLLSGGVDSTVAFALCAKALPKERLRGLYVDTGLMRLREPHEFIETMRSLGVGDRVALRYEADLFLAALQGLTDPEEKRRMIGHLFVDIQAQAVQAYGIDPAHWLLGQGTIYPDTIESGGDGGQADVIKTHHNRCPEIQALIQQGRVLEPLRSCYKDEVRRIGAALGLPPKILQKWPFPGPGLAVRVIGPVTAERVALVQAADEIIEDEIQHAGLYTALWQAFAVLLPVTTVGVMGDRRTTGSVIAIRAVTSTDGMTADWTHLPHDLLARIATRIVNEVAGVTRVVYDITSKPPATIEWE